MWTEDGSVRVALQAVWFSLLLSFCLRFGSLSSERFEASGLVMQRLKFVVSLRNEESGQGSSQASSPFLFHFVFCYFWFTQ